MLKVSNFRRSLFVGKTLSCWCSPSTACAKTLEYSLRIQRIPLVTSCRLASSTSDLQNLELIYDGPMARKVRAIKLLTLGCSLTSIPVQTYILATNDAVSNSLPAKIMLSVFIVFQALTPFLIHFVGKRYAVRLYHNPVTDKYTVETYKLYPTIKSTTFRASECRPPKVEVFATVVIGKKMPIFLDPRYFTDVQHYKKLLGYDKPINFSDDDDNEGNTGTIPMLNDVKDKEKPN